MEEKKTVEKKKATEKKPVEKKYIVCITGFLFRGKMFRADQVIDEKIYKDFISQWLKEGKIREV